MFSKLFSKYMLVVFSLIIFVFFTGYGFSLQYGTTRSQLVQDYGEEYEEDYEGEYEEDYEDEYEEDYEDEYEEIEKSNSPNKKSLEEKETSKAEEMEEEKETPKAEEEKAQEEEKEERKKNRKKITDEIIPLLDIYLYIGGGGGGILGEQDYSSARFSPRSIFDVKINNGGSFALNTMLAIFILGFKISYSYNGYRIANQNARTNTLVVKNGDSFSIIDSLVPERGGLHILEVTVGLNTLRREKSASYSYLYFGYKYYRNLQYGKSNGSQYNAEIFNNGFTFGYELLYDFKISGLNAFSILLSIGASLGYFPVSRHTLELGGNKVTTNVQSSSDIISRAGNFFFAAKGGVGVKIFGIQAIVEYRAEYSFSIVGRQGFQLFKAGLVNNIVFLLGYKF